MRKTATAILLTTAVLLTGCSNSDSSDTPDTAACKAAMEKQLTDAIDTGAEGTRPAACEGIDDATLKRLAGEAISDRLKEDTEDAVRDATGGEDDQAATPIPDECREWIESELLDSSDSIDADAGSSACAGLSDAEMDQAIDDVTNDLMEQDTP
jgi:major membrane immunogen (membrane-anchored lipoprotein)